MQDGLCSKKYPKQYISESQLGLDSNPIYKRSSLDDGGQVSTISMRVGGTHIDQQVDNRWIVPFVVDRVLPFEVIVMIDHLWKKIQLVIMVIFWHCLSFEFKLVTKYFQII